MSAKKFIGMMILFVCFLVSVSGVNAQNKPGDKAGRISDMLYKKLNQSDDQYTKIYSSLLGYFEVKSTETGSKKSMETAEDKNWSKTNSEITSVLNKEQLSVYSGMSEKKLMSAASYRPRKKVTKTEQTETTEQKKTTTQEKTNMNKTTPETKKSQQPNTEKNKAPDKK